MNAKEMIASKKISHILGKCFDCNDYDGLLVAEAILNLRYPNGKPMLAVLDEKGTPEPCKQCSGSGLREPLYRSKDTDCEACNGTGKESE